jgi:hypothetical protein
MAEEAGRFIRLAPIFFILLFADLTSEYCLKPFDFFLHIIHIHGGSEKGHGHFSLLLSFKFYSLLLDMDSHFVLALFHLIIIVPFLLFIGFKRADTPHWVYMSVFATGIIILLYHSFRLFTRLRANSSNAWINAIHVLLVAPLLIYIGYHKKETPRSAYELLLLLAFGAGGYHLFSLVKMLEVDKE